MFDHFVNLFCSKIKSKIDVKNLEPIFIDKSSKNGVLLLHGFTSSAYEFSELSKFLAEKGFNVYAPTIAGHGTCPEDLMNCSIDDWKESAKNAYLKLKEKSEKIFIVGDSFGSNLAFWLANNFNNEPAAIVTWGAPIFLRNHLFNVLSLYSLGFIVKYIRPTSYRKYYDESDLLLIEKVSYEYVPTKSIRNLLSFIERETKPKLKEIKVPVFITHSKSDPLIHPKSADYIYSNLGSFFKKKYFFAAGNTHMAPKRIREELYDKISGFIQEVFKNQNN